MLTERKMRARAPERIISFGGLDPRISNAVDEVNGRSRIVASRASNGIPPSGAVNPVAGVPTIRCLPAL